MKIIVIFSLKLAFFQTPNPKTPGQLPDEVPLADGRTIRRPAAWAAILRCGTVGFALDSAFVFSRAEHIDHVAENFGLLDFLFSLLHTLIPENPG